MSIHSLPDLHKAQRLLIIRLSSIGDVTHALPISAALGEAFPHLEITWVVEEMSAQIVTGNPYLKEVLVVPRSRWKQGRLRSPQVWREYLAFLSGLRRRKFDVTLDLQGYAKSGLMALAAGAPHRFGWWRQRDGAGLISHALPHRPESLHRVDWFLDVARAFGADPNPVRFPLHIPAEARAYVAELLRSATLDSGAKYAVLNPAVGDQMRRWGAERYAQLAILLQEKYRFPCVLIGSGKDVPICEEVIARARQLRGEYAAAGRVGAADDSEPPLINLAGKTDLKELMAALEGCAVHISGDTGSAHIAAALPRPVVALYGPTDPLHAGPYNQSSHVLSHRELCHATCTNRQCAFTKQANAGDSNAVGEKTVRCLSAITPEEVLEKVEQVLNGG